MDIKVFHILGYLAARYGGPPKVAINLGQAMAEYGIDSYWWATATAEEKKELAYLGDKACLFPSRFPHSWYRSPELDRELKKRIDRADILHLHQIWDHPLWIAARLARKRGKPYIITTHGIFSKSWRYESIKKRIYTELMARFILDNASVIHAITKQEVNGFKKLGIYTPHVIISNGIDTSEFQTILKPEYAEKIWPLLKGKKVVLFLGRLSPEKGLAVLLKSWKYIIQEHPDALLVIAGPDYKGYSDKVRKIVNRCGLVNEVFFTGLVQRDEKKAMLSRANLFVLPSYSEGFSTVVLEALASGKPCILTAGCNFPEVQEEGAGYVIPTGDKEALSNALSKMMALSDVQRKEMGQYGKQLVVRKYTVDIMALKMLSVYRCVLDHKPVPLYPNVV